MAQCNFKEFINDFSECHSGKIKGAISVYLKINYLTFISSLLQQGYTVKMVYLRILKKEPKLEPYLNFNTLRSFVRKNIKKGQLYEYKLSKNSSNLIVNNSPFEEKLNLKNSGSVLQTDNLKKTALDSKSIVTTQRDLTIPKPQEPIQPASKDSLKELSGFDLDDFFIDSNGYLFDGFSADSIANLVPVPNQFQLLAQQDGIKKHYFLYKNQTVDSKNILSFIKEKIRTGTLSFTFRKL